MAQPDFWDNQEEARRTIADINRLKNSIVPLIEYQKKIADAEAMVDLVEEMGDDDDGAYQKELETMIRDMADELNTLEINCFLSGPLDSANAIMSIHAGAGGTESCDWADMLFRMYSRWAERNGFKVDIQDLQEGDEAGISKITFRISGPNAYGYAKAERGVHRLVRISPFDSNKRRHTSFCSVDVIAEVEDDIDVDIQPDDLRVDTYRSSGKGGQHVNKTDSAVRLTHIPTGLVVACQNERSQLKNKESAMKVLKSRLYERLQDEKREEMEKFYGEKGEMGWGHQIRSYVFQPYQMIKDLRTGMESGNVQEVMDGGIDAFIHAWLRAGCPSIRNKEVKIEE